MGGLENTQENFADFCCEVGQLLCRSLAITHEKFYKPTSGRFTPLQSTWQNGRVGCSVLIEVDGLDVYSDKGFTGISLIPVIGWRIKGCL